MAFDHAFKVLHDYEVENAGDEAHIDAAGLMRDVAANAAQTKRDLLSEIPNERGWQRGSEYKVNQPETTSRSYSAAAIFASFLERDPDLLNVIKYLVAADALRLQWQWKNLKSEMYRLELPMTIAPREISSDDPKHHVGEVKSTGSAEFVRM